MVTDLEQFLAEVDERDKAAKAQAPSYMPTKASQADVEGLVAIARFAAARLRYIHEEAYLDDARTLARDGLDTLNSLACEAMEASDAK